MKQLIRSLRGIFFALLLLAAACSPAPTAAPAPTTPQATPTPSTASTATQNQANLSALYAKSPYIVDPANFSWPRTVKDMSGAAIQIGEKPQRIVALSLGFEEISLALVAPTRMAAVSTFVSEPYSNITGAAASIKARVTRDPETILAIHPDLVIAYHLTKPELVKQLRDAGLTVVQIDGGEKSLIRPTATYHRF